MLKDESEVLSPCPFCGGAALRKPDPGRLNEMFGLVVDHKPGCFLAFRGYETDDVIDAAWNNRTPPAQAEASADDEGANKAGGLWYKRWHAAQTEINRLRGLLVDPGDPAWENMRGILVAELRKAELPDHAASVAEGGGSYIPSWIALNLMATIAKGQAEASTLPGEVVAEEDIADLVRDFDPHDDRWQGDFKGNANVIARKIMALAATPPTTPAVESGEDGRCWSCSCGWVGCYTRAELKEHGKPSECSLCFRERLEECDPPRPAVESESADRGAVERVARAISEYTYALINDAGDCGEWEDMSETARKVYMKAARAARAAMNGETT